MGELPLAAADSYTNKREAADKDDTVRGGYARYAQEEKTMLPLNSAHVPAPTPAEPGRAVVRLIRMRAVIVVAAAAVVCVAALSACTASQRSPASLTFLDKLIFAVFALVSIGVWAGLCITHVSAWGRSGRVRRY